MEAILSKENLVRYSTLQSTIIGAQVLATKGYPSSKGWEYWLRLVAGTSVGIVGGKYLGDLMVTQLFTTVSATKSSASVASETKESDVSDM